MAKLDWFEIVCSGRVGVQLLATAVSAVLTVTAIALLPRVLRRLGAGYFAYALVVVLLSALAGPEFIGMGRYLLVALPVYAVAAAAAGGGGGSARGGWRPQGSSPARRWCSWCWVISASDGEIGHLVRAHRVRTSCSSST